MLQNMAHALFKLSFQIIMFYVIKIRSNMRVRSTFHVEIWDITAVKFDSRRESGSYDSVQNLVTGATYKIQSVCFQTDEVAQERTGCCKRVARGVVFVFV